MCVFMQQIESEQLYAIYILCFKTSLTLLLSLYMIALKPLPVNGNVPSLLPCALCIT